MKKIFPFSLTAMLILAIALSGCGGGSGGSSPSADEQAIQTCFSSIGIDGNSFFRSDMYATSLHAADVQPFSWDTASFTATGYTQNLTNITFDSATTAHATAHFTVTAGYSIGGDADSSGIWSGSGTLSLSGSGIITFVKTDGTWTIDQIPEAIYLSNSTTSPTIDDLSIPAKASKGTEETISGTITSHDTTNRRDGFTILTGFGKTISRFPASTISELITIPESPGNIYGAITVIELAGDGTSSASTYYLNACAYMGMIKVYTVVGT